MESALKSRIFNSEPRKLQHHNSILEVVSFCLSSHTLINLPVLLSFMLALLPPSHLRPPRDHQVSFQTNPSSLMSARRMSTPSSYKPHDSIRANLRCVNIWILPRDATNAFFLLHAWRVGWSRPHHSQRRQPCSGSWLDDVSFASKCRNTSRRSMYRNEPLSRGRRPWKGLSMALRRALQLMASVAREITSR